MYVVAAKSPIMMMIRVIVHDDTKPIMVPIVLLPACSVVARVGKSPNLLGVAIAPTWPRIVANSAVFIEIFSMFDTAYFHLVASARMLNGINKMQKDRKNQCEDMLLPI